MTKKHQNQAGTPPSPEEIMAQFSAVWQEKWQDMLREKGWPSDAPTPSMAAMPFMNPFMMPMMMGQPSTNDTIILELVKKISVLEKRIIELEGKKTRMRKASTSSLKSKTTSNSKGKR